MPPPNKPTLPPAAEPKYGKALDPWNSVSTGHQRPEQRGPQGWRESRNMKLHSQFVAGHSGGKRISDTVGAGSEDFNEKHKVLIPKEVRSRAQNSVMDMLRKPGTMMARERKDGVGSGSSAGSGSGLGAGGDGSEGGLVPAATAGLSKEESQSTKGPVPTAEEELMAARKAEDEELAAKKQQGRKIFDGLCVYVNGSTHPLVSDHKLKHLLTENGARMSIHLGRRQVTHVILGRPSSGPGARGAGGGLAAGKLEKEIRRGRGCGVKYVSVEWVLESVKAGKRLPEARFAGMKVAAKGQQSVLGAFSNIRDKAATLHEPASRPAS